MHFSYECTKLIEKTQGKKTEQEDILNEKNKEAKEVLGKGSTYKQSSKNLFRVKNKVWCYLRSH